MEMMMVVVVVVVVVVAIVVVVVLLLMMMMMMMMMILFLIIDKMDRYIIKKTNMKPQHNLTRKKKTHKLKVILCEFTNHRGFLNAFRVLSLELPSRISDLHSAKAGKKRSSLQRSLTPH
jgi:uncharacterized membrane protein affecting hemolysin expression